MDVILSTSQLYSVARSQIRPSFLCLLMLWILAGQLPVLAKISPTSKATPDSSSASDTTVANPLTPTGPSSIQPSLYNPKNVPALTSKTVGIRQAFDEALLYNPRVAAIRAQLKVAKAAYWTASQLPNPQFFLYNGYHAEQTYQLGANLPIEPMWEIVMRMIYAKQQVKQADLQIMNQLWQLRGQTRRTYTELVVAQETLETLQDLTELARRLQDVATKRFQAGDVPELDVLKARLATSQADIDREQGARRVVQAKQQLNIIMGRKTEQEIEVPRLPTFKLKAEISDLLPDFQKPVPPLNEYLTQAMLTRLELKIIKQRIAVAQAGLRNAIASLWPTPQISTLHSITGNPPVGPKLRGWDFVLQASVPMGTVNQGDIANFKATIRQLNFETDGQKNIIAGEVSSAYQQLLAARERIRVYQEHVLADSAEVARLARRSYEVGQSDITSTLQAQQANIQVRSQYLDAVLAYQLAFTNLEQAIGRPVQ